MTLPKNGRASDRSPPAFQFYPGDFMRDEKVAAMTYAERGIYISLLCYAWEEGSIPSDLRAIGRLLRLGPRSLQSAWALVGQCWKPGADGRLINPRMERERALQAAFRAERVANGRKGADALHRGKQRGSAMAPPAAGHGPASQEPLAQHGPTSTPPVQPSASLRSAGAAPPGPAPAPDKPARKDPTGDHAAAIAHWHAEFLRTRGSPYAFGGKKDGEHVKVLLASSSLAEFKMRATALLESRDAFYAGADLGTLRSNFNKFAARRAPPRPSYDRPTEPQPAPGPKVDPAVAKRAIKDALAAAVKGFTAPSEATEGA